MSSLGELYFSLGLNDEAFNKAIEEAKKKVANLTGEATITVNVNAENVKKQVQDSVKQLQGKEAEINIDTNIDFAKIENLKARLKESREEAARLKETMDKASSESAKNAIRPDYYRAKNRVDDINGRLAEMGVVDDQSLKGFKLNLSEAQSRLRDLNLEYDEFKSKISGKKRLSQADKDNQDFYDTNIENEKKSIDKYERLIQKANEYRAAVAKLEAEKKKASTGGTKDVQIEPIKPTEVKVVIDEESYKQVKARLAQLEEPIKPQIQVEYDRDRFSAIATTIKNFTERLSELGKVRLSIDDSFLRTGMSADYGKGVKGFIEKANDYLLGDDTGDAGRSISSLQRMLDKHTFKIKVDIDAAQLASTVQSKVKKVPVDVDVDIEAVKKRLKQLKVPLDFDTKQAISDAKAMMKNQEFKAKLELVVDKMKLSKAIKAALKKQGLNYNTTASDVRQQRILEIQQRMNQSQKRFDGYIKKSNKSMTSLGGSTKVAGDWAGQLANQFSNFISIYSIERFVRTLYTIGGEFQKQQIALRSMIGDAAKGDAIFERMKDLSVKSPFTFSELSSYTKQMAAYGIEYEELYNTTKRLADISAGVGVDMGRIILAYGQVRSAEVLRGQELRQFTEAGIPLVEELAKRLSKVRGEAVKVGEVFDAISKRQVSFDMVKDVLFDMTDPGGRFFEMQEELAKSLAGQWSNLKDAWDIMIADIANGSDNVLSGLAGRLADILRTWRDWLPMLAAVTTAIGVVTSAIRVATTAQILWDTVTKANPWMAAATILLSIVGAMISFSAASEITAKNTTQLNSELDKEIQKWNENRINALRYLDTLKSANTSEERRILLYKELLELYPDVFEGMNMEAVLLEKTAKLKTDINNATINKQVNDINEELKPLLQRYDDLRKKRRVGSTEFVVGYRPPTKEEAAAEAALLTQIQSLQKQKDDVQKGIDRAGKIEELTPNSPLSKYVEVYRELGKAVKILRQGGVMGEVANPKELTSTLEYYEQLNTLLEEQEGIKKKFKPNTNEYKEADRLSKVYKNAISAIGGRWSTSGKSPAEEAAEREAKAYLDTLKAKLSELGSQWDLFKDLLEATGDKNLSMDIAFDGVLPNFENYIEHLKGLMQEEINKKKLGISVDDLLAGGKEGIAKRVNDTTLTAWTEDVANNLNAILDSYNNANKKLREESVRNFIEIINNSKSFAQQIADIDRKLQKDLNDLAEMSGGSSSEVYKKRAPELIKKAEEDKSKVKFEEFKESSDWVKVFDDLDRVSNATLDKMISKVEEYANGIHLSEEVTKQLVEAMAKLREEAIERNPFQGFANAIREYNKWSNPTTETNPMVLNNATGKFEPKYSKDDINNFLKAAEADLVTSVEKIANTFDDMRNVVDPLIDTLDALGVSSGGVMDVLEGMSNALGAASSMSSSLSNIMGLKLGSGEDAKSLGSALGLQNAGLWGAAAGAALSIVGSIAGAHDKKLDKAINKSKLEVEKLTNAYKNLESVLERQLGSATYGQSKAMITNLKTQREEVAKQMALEDEKKKTDKSKMKDYKQQLVELDEQIKYFYEDLANEQYGIDIKDWAGQLSDALVDAFANGEDAAAAFDKTVGDILKGLAKEMITLEVMQPAFDRVRDYLFNETNGVATLNSAEGTDLTAKEIGGLANEMNHVKDSLKDAEKLWEALNKASGGLLESAEGASEGLSKGIQGVTEDTAGLLASYINAMRADVSVKRSLLEKLMAEDVPQMNYIAQAQLTQLNSIAANTLRNADAADRIYDLVNRVVDKGNGKLRIS